RIRTMEAALIQYGERDPENKRRATTDLHRYANARKAFSGQYQGLLDPRVLSLKAEREESLFPTQRAPGSGPNSKTYDDAVRRIAEIQKVYATFERPYLLIESGSGATNTFAFPTQLFTIARHIVRLTFEIGKPNGDRLREYRDSNLDSLKLELFSPAPMYPDLECAKLLTGLTFLAEQLGGEHPLVSKALDGKSAGKRADELIAGTKLFDPAERKRLVEGGLKAVEASDDPMVVFARTMDSDARALRKRFEEEVEEPERQAYAEIAKVRFAVL